MVSTLLDLVPDHCLTCLLHVMDLHNRVYNVHVGVRKYFVSLLECEDLLLLNMFLLRSNPRLLFCYCLPG